MAKIKFGDDYLDGLYDSDYHEDDNNHRIYIDQKEYLRDMLGSSSSDSSVKSKWAGKQDTNLKTAKTSRMALSDTESVRSVYSWGLSSKFKKKWMDFSFWLKDPWKQIHFVGVLTMVGPGIFHQMDDTGDVFKYAPIYFLEGVSAVFVPLIISTIGIEGTMVIGYIGYILNEIMLCFNVPYFWLQFACRLVMGFLISCFRVVNTTCVFTFAGPRHKAIFIAIFLGYGYMGSIVGAVITMFYSTMSYKTSSPYDPYEISEIKLSMIPFACLTVTVFLLAPLFWRPVWSFSNSEGQRMSFGVPKNVLSLLKEWKILINEGLMWFAPQWFLQRHFLVYRKSYMCRLFTTVRASLVNQIVLNLSKIAGLVLAVFSLRLLKQQQKTKMKAMQHFITVINLLFIATGAMISHTLCNGKVDLFLKTDVTADVNTEWASFPNQIVSYDDGGEEYMDGCTALKEYDIHVGGSRVRCVTPGFYGQGQLDFSNSVTLQIDAGQLTTKPPTLTKTNGYRFMRGEGDVEITSAEDTTTATEVPASQTMSVSGSLTLDYRSQYTLLVLATIIGGITYGISEFAMYWFVAIIAMSYAHRLTTMLTLTTFFNCMGKVTSLFLHAVPGLLWRQQNYLNLVFYFALELTTILGIEWTNRGEWEELVDNGNMRMNTGSPSDRDSDWESSYEYYYSYESSPMTADPPLQGGRNARMSIHDTDNLKIVGTEAPKSPLKKLNEQRAVKLQRARNRAKRKSVAFET